METQLLLSDKHAYPFLVLAFSSDGHLVASGSYRMITLWDQRTKKHMTLESNEVVRRLAF